MSGYWWWDPWIGSQPNLSLMRDLAKIQFRDLMNQDPPTHWVLFLSCDVFFEYISSEIVYFYLKYYGLFLYSKSSRSTITASKMFHITAPWCHNKHPLSCHNGFVMLSRQLYHVYDITMEWWHCHWYQTIMWQTAWIFYTRSRKTWILYTRSR